MSIFITNQQILQLKIKCLIFMLSEEITWLLHQNNQKTPAAIGDIAVVLIDHDGSEPDEVHYEV